jgi:hypothetical protein
MTAWYNMIRCESIGACVRACVRSWCIVRIILYMRCMSSRDGGRIARVQIGCAGRRGRKHRRNRGLPDEAPVIEAAFPARFSAFPFRKCVPEAERLVSRARDDRLAIRAHREV